jgi:hypothetical protein
VSSNEDVIPLLTAYSSMTVQLNGTSSSSTSTASGGANITESYVTDYVSSTTYKITLSFSESSASSSGVSGSYTLWVLKNGTVTAAAISIGGNSQNLTGSEANEIVVGVFAGFITDVAANANLGAYTSSSYFHSTGSSSVTIGTTTMTVTNYAAITLPVTITNCDGSTTNLTAYALSVGTPPGAKGPLVTYAHFAGTTTQTDGSMTTFNEVIQVTSFTLA